MRIISSSSSMVVIVLCVSVIVAVVAVIAALFSRTKIIPLKTTTMRMMRSTYKTPFSI